MVRCVMIKNTRELSKELPRPRFFIYELRRVPDLHVLLYLWLGGSQRSC